MSAFSSDHRLWDANRAHQELATPTFEAYTKITIDNDWQKQWEESDGGCVTNVTHPF